MEAFLGICDFTAHSLLRQHPPLFTTPKSICSTAPVHPTLTTAESSGIYSLLIRNIAYSALEGETEQVCGKGSPAPGVCEGMSRHHICGQSQGHCVISTAHLTFAVLLNSRQSCSSSLSFFEATTGLGIAKTRYSPASAWEVHVRDLTSQTRGESSFLRFNFLTVCVSHLFIRT